MKSGDSRPTALKALLRPFQIASRSVGVARGTDCDRLACGDDLLEPHAIRGHDFARAFQFDDEHGFATRRIFGMHRGLGRFQRERVHDFHRARQQAAGDDGGDGIARPARACA